MRLQTSGVYAKTNEIIFLYRIINVKKIKLCVFNIKVAISQDDEMSTVGKKFIRTYLLAVSQTTVALRLCRRSLRSTI